MNPAIEKMLSRYKITTKGDAENALKEIVQEIALLGLQRANFFERAAFYGGTALRILYSLPRYSEDLDFTLLKPEANFSLKPYFSAVEKELQSFGFEVTIDSVEKENAASEIESAFIKANTRIHLLKIEAFNAFAKNAQREAKLKIKFEVDTEPAVDFKTETRFLINPIPFPVISLQRPDLFAGKLHALLYRQWGNRIKGRDFYDYIWYLQNGTPVRLSYLREKAIQSGHARAGELVNLKDLKFALLKRFATIDFEAAKKDVAPFIRDQAELAIWSRDFFSQITERLQVVEG